MSISNDFRLRWGVVKEWCARAVVARTFSDLLPHDELFSVLFTGHVHGGNFMFIYDDFPELLRRRVHPYKETVEKAKAHLVRSMETDGKDEGIAPSYYEAMIAHLDACAECAEQVPESIFETLAWKRTMDDLFDRAYPDRRKDP